MAHGVALLPYLGTLANARNAEESTPCTLSRKIKPDSHGSSPGMTPSMRRGSMTKIETLRKKWMKDPAFRKEYDALEEEFALIA
jgi:hypothetical protein